MRKTNEYTGETYECKCDYSYTCNGCMAVRKAFAKGVYEREIQAWTIESIKAIAESLNVEIPPVPKLDDCRDY